MRVRVLGGIAKALSHIKQLAQSMSTTVIESCVDQIKIRVSAHGVLGEPNIVPGGTISQPELHMKNKTTRANGESIL